MAAATSVSDRKAEAIDALLSHAVMGGGLPEPIERHLLAASQSYHLGDVAEAHLREAGALAPDHAAVLIGLYRFYFYKGRLAEAVEIAGACLKLAARRCNFAVDWRQVDAGDAAFSDWEALWPRFFLFTLKGYAYLNMRLGRIEEAKHAIAKLLALDPSDKINAKLLLDILDRAEADDAE